HHLLHAPLVEDVQALLDAHHEQSVLPGDVILLGNQAPAGLVHFLEAQKNAALPDQPDQAVADSWWLDHQSADACPWTLTLSPHSLRVSFATGDGRAATARAHCRSSVVTLVVTLPSVPYSCRSWE